MSRSYLKRTISKLRDESSNSGEGIPPTIATTISSKLSSSSSPSSSRLIAANQKSTISSLALENERLKAMLMVANGFYCHENQALENNNFVPSIESNNNLIPIEENIINKEEEQKQISTTIKKDDPCNENDEEMFGNNNKSSLSYFENSMTTSVDSRIIPDNEDNDIQKFYLCAFCKIVVFKSYDEVIKHQETCHECSSSDDDDNDAFDEDDRKETSNKLNPSDGDFINSNMVEKQKRTRSEENIITENAGKRMRGENHTTAKEPEELNDNDAYYSLLEPMEEITAIFDNNETEKDECMSLGDPITLSSSFPTISLENKSFIPNNNNDLNLLSQVALNDEYLKSALQKFEKTNENTNNALTIPLAMKEDEKRLIPLHCFIRKNLIHIFHATIADTKGRKIGRGKSIFRF